MNPLIQLKKATRLFRAMLVLACFTLSARVQAVSPPPDGGYANFNTAEGQYALFSLTGGIGNTANGFDALYRNTTGGANTANGENALYSNTAGYYNTATGSGALYYNTIGFNNTASGFQALLSNTDGGANTASGFQALYRNTTGGNNTANGENALYSNTMGFKNTASGFQALFSNTTGDSNTANGDNALFSNTTASDNTANGFEALLSNTTGIDNTANGVNALYANTIGNYNAANGVNALYHNTTGQQNTGTGVNSLLYNTTGNYNTAMGTNAGKNLTTGSGNVCIGTAVLGVAGESNTTRIRNIYSSVASGRAVYVNSDNKIGTLASTRRVKNDIKPMDKASEAVLALKPVSFRYKKEIDASGTLQFGLVAEEVADINADLVTRDSEGKPETVRYDAVNAMLLNEFLKEHRKVQELEARLAQQKKDFNARLNEQDAKIQTVSDKMELNKAAPRTVGNN